MSSEKQPGFLLVTMQLFQVLLFSTISFKLLPISLFAPVCFLCTFKNRDISGNCSESGQDTKYRDLPWKVAIWVLLFQGGGHCLPHGHDRGTKWIWSLTAAAAELRVLANLQCTVPGASSPGSKYSYFIITGPQGGTASDMASCDWTGQRMVPHLIWLCLVSHVLKGTEVSGSDGWHAIACATSCSIC